MNISKKMLICVIGYRLKMCIIICFIFANINAYGCSPYVDYDHRLVLEDFTSDDFFFAGEVINIISKPIMLGNKRIDTNIQYTFKVDSVLKGVIADKVFINQLSSSDVIYLTNAAINKLEIKESLLSSPRGEYMGSSACGGSGRFSRNINRYSYNIGEKWLISGHFYTKEKEYVIGNRLSLSPLKNTYPECLYHNNNLTDLSNIVDLNFGRLDVKSRKKKSVFCLGSYFRDFDKIQADPNYANTIILLKRIEADIVRGAGKKIK